MEDNEIYGKSDVIKNMIIVHSKKIGKDITTDYTLALFDENEKSYIIEMNDNAKKSVAMIERMIEKWKVWKWKQGRPKEYDPNKHVITSKGYWEKTKDNTKDKELEKIRENIYMAYALRTQLMSILSRNKARNPIMDYITEIRKELEEAEEAEKNKLALETAKEVIKPREEK